MTDQLTAVIEPFVRRGLFPNSERAVMQMARDYVLRQIEHYREITDSLQSTHGMTREQFEAYLKERSARLMTSPNPALNRVLMAEEEDALEWKIASEMLQSWLGLQTEVGE